MDVLVITSEKLLNSRLRYLGLAAACVLILDEAHHAHGNHSYSRICDTYHSIPTSARPLLLALTASPMQKSNHKLEGLRAAIAGLRLNLKTKIAYPFASLGDLNIHQIVPEGRCISSSFSAQDLKLYQNILSYSKSVVGLLESHHPQLGNLTSILEVDVWQLRLYLRSHRRKRAGKHGIHESAAIVCHLLEILSVLEVLEVLGSEIALRGLHKLIQNVQTPTTPMERIKKAILSPLSTMLRDFMEYRTAESEQTCGWTVLISVLKDFVEDGDQAKRCTIFVLTRKTAYRLQTMLKSVEEIRQHLNPKVTSTIDYHHEYQRI